MLVLTRRAGESIFIGDNIKLVVLETKGEQIRLGIDAPRSISVHRGEVYEAIQRANREAVTSIPTPKALEDLLAGK
ncbi:carbon storage regulator CsrA [Heliorestis acidaminivorans]|uniref:Translational regulator CsrA n=1 Tax=Heliorestis acidaminivorans TaxID=553427 RepID=A0A6I0ETW6_9FIRM|nr:carbon storage regulator CsrA [Heliorestis acidaminivorans]KAB2953634.1 carbon storage regulator CsrA [Heliorestis acidaminivorans]